MEALGQDLILSLINYLNGFQKVQIGKIKYTMPLLVLMGQIDLMILDYSILKRVEVVYLILVFIHFFFLISF